MRREVFLKKVVRYLLYSLVIALVYMLGNRIATGNDCSGCPGNGICSGSTDCSKYQIKK